MAHLLAELITQTWFIAVMGLALIGGVLLSVHHAEVVAHKTGEPYGALVLAISVTIIEVSLIISMMLSVLRLPCWYCYLKDLLQLGQPKTIALKVV